MSAPVLTPITQALADGTLTRVELKTLMQRSNGPAFRHLALWIVVLACTGSLIFLAYDSWLIWPAMFLHGVVMVHHFSLQHECCHYTVFKTRWINDVIGNICGFIIMLPNRHFRYEHCDHHTYTQLHGDDPEMIELPQSLGGYFWYLSSIPYWRNKFTELARHTMGRLTPEEERFIPRPEHQTIFWEARLMLIGYLVILAACTATGWWAPIWYWWLPVVLGEPVMRFIRMTEHVGKPCVRDMKENTRTNYVARPMQFLAWNMNYHAEHHYAASVPFYALPALHEKLKTHVAVEPRGYLGAHIDILGQLTGRTPRSDAAEAG
ncbi:fatty acid desaturase family protein [uncultured Sulfitobacter sp.]|uniref:fatty acid desaturase family protein n=1 Tax=uncultured Sulfitobacter sp. TaxID=191468 RepID=UPI0026340797|nr:fatty acid desaturase family protein [uncultured Sulfitobacter sp.]